MKNEKTKKAVWLAVAAVGIGTVVLGQDAAGDKITVPFSDPSRPKTLVVNQIQGSITVRGYNGNEAIIEGEAARRRSRSGPEGMHRIDTPGGTDVTESNNVITVNGGVMRSSNVTIQVPVQTTVRLKTVNGGKITVEGITGDVEAQNTNGSVSVTDVSGSVVASSTNGKVIVSLNHVTPNKTMSFSTFNGSIDVTLPADTKANLRMRTDNGEIWTDFDVKVQGSPAPVVEDDAKNHSHHVKVDNSVLGTINGGGPEIQLRTFNGSIYLRKK